MFKLTITLDDGYSLLGYSYKQKKWLPLTINESLDSIIGFINQHLPGKVIIEGYEGIKQAVKEMSDSNHNTAEFGMLHGAFTVSYNDKSIV